MKHGLLKLGIGMLMLMTTADLFAQQAPATPAVQPVIQLYAHRGSRFEFDENTIGAFKASYAAGLRRFETDIRMTKDGELVLAHDASFKRLTPCTLEAEAMTAAEIRQITTNQGNKVSFLNELTDFLSGKDSVLVEWEMKTNAPESSYPEDRLREYCGKVYDMVMSKKPAHSQYVFTSFDPRALKMMRSLHPEADLLLIVSKPINDETIAQAKELGVKRLGGQIAGTCRDAVKKGKKEGLTISVYPGRSVDDFLLGYYLGVNSMTCDGAVAVKKFMDTKATFIKYK